MPYRPDLAVPHGPGCACDNCRKQWITTDGQLTSLERLAWIEKRLIDLQNQIQDIAKGNNKMGYALWCKPGDHSFDEHDPGAKRMTTDEIGKDGEKTGRDVTYHICSRHAASLLTPQKKSLREIQQQLDEATEIGD